MGVEKVRRGGGKTGMLLYESHAMEKTRRGKTGFLTPNLGNGAGGGRLEVGGRGRGENMWTTEEGKRFPLRWGDANDEVAELGRM